MHEVSIAGAIIESVLGAAKKNNASKVKEIFLDIGELTALNPVQIEFIFKTITRGTVAEGAKYNIQLIKPLVHCGRCSYSGPVGFFEQLHFFLPEIRCPQCGEPEVDIVAGRECCIKKIIIA